MKFWRDLLGESTGKSSKRFVMLVATFCVCVFGGLMFVVEVKTNNITLLDTIINGLITVILGVAVVSGAEKFRKSKNEPTNETE
jgi:hypothetical protein